MNINGDGAGYQRTATLAAYREHLDTHQCQEQSWCSERDELDFAADAAVYAYVVARQQMRAERVAEGIA